MSAPSFFGIILPSRPVQTSPVAISPTQFAFTLPSNPPFAHVVVFLLPGIVLPDATLAAIYIQLPGTNPEFKLLGALSNDKQSAIFKVKNELFINGVDRSGEDEMTDIDSSSASASTNNGVAEVTIGISIEASATILPQLSNLQASQVAPSDPSTALVRPNEQLFNRVSTKALAQRIIKDAFNFLASFAGKTDPSGEEVLPLKSFRDWWAKFERKIENDPGFLEREGD